MGWTKKHFIAVAGILGQSDLTEDQIMDLAEDFSALFARENERFQKDTFRRAVVGEIGRVRYEEKKRGSHD